MTKIEKKVEVIEAEVVNEVKKSKKGKKLLALIGAGVLALVGGIFFFVRKGTKGNEEIQETETNEE